ncbi:MAG TPA: hypothetical protein ENJ63_03175 [Dissulfuribacter thermophilus]|uniref:Zinc ABC transporter, periplasmic-binding protein ZnuA n=1 Tax=Dissulfuribacter thermophilus TaxID=1156395 RepID=A0A7V2SZ02_9BACT|nr:hypothetical protein [Dissulfuribacter thermophilus]
MKTLWVFLLLFVVSWPLALHAGLDGRDKPLVISTILPWGEFLKGICGDDCEVKVLIPPGSTPHTWSPSPNAVKDVQDSSFFVYTDDCLEPWAKEFLAMHRDTGGADWWFRVSSLVGKKCPPDPHLWLDFTFDQEVVSALVKRLSDIMPQYAKSFRKNGQGLIMKLKSLHESYKRSLARCKHKTMVIAGHNAFGYLARAYGLETLSVMGISPDAQITPGSLGRVIAFLRETGAGAVFFDHAVTDRIARTITLETRAKAYRLSPGVSLTRDYFQKGLGFFEIMEENLNALKLGLQCE